MRLIWTTDNADHFRTFCSYLHVKCIVFTTDEQVVRDWASDTYGNRKYLLWITDEDQVNASVDALVRFIDAPTAQEFSKPETKETVIEFIEEKIKPPSAPPEQEVK